MSPEKVCLHLLGRHHSGVTPSSVPASPGMSLPGLVRFEPQDLFPEEQGNSPWPKRKPSPVSWGCKASGWPSCLVSSSRPLPVAMGTKSLNKAVISRGRLLSVLEVSEQCSDVGLPLSVAGASYQGEHPAPVLSPSAPLGSRENRNGPTTVTALAWPGLRSVLLPSSPSTYSSSCWPQNGVTFEQNCSLTRPDSW